MALHRVEHPLARHLLSGLRSAQTAPDRFRRLSDSLSRLLMLEATRDLPLKDVHVETPIEFTEGQVLAQGLAVVPILRSGLSMLEAAVDLFPDVAVGYIGLERDEDTAVARSYYTKLPNFEDRLVMVLDPMVATGGSASKAVTLCKEAGAESVRLVSVICSPEGIERFAEDHPTVDVVTAAVDRELNGRKFIVPGLGDYGDRLYGTW